MHSGCSSSLDLLSKTICISRERSSSTGVLGKRKLTVSRTHWWRWEVTIVHGLVIKSIKIYLNKELKTMQKWWTSLKNQFVIMLFYKIMTTQVFVSIFCRWLWLMKGSQLAIDDEVRKLLNSLYPRSSSNQQSLSTTYLFPMTWGICFATVSVIIAIRWDPYEAWKPQSHLSKRNYIMNLPKTFGLEWLSELVC